MTYPRAIRHRQVGTAIRNAVIVNILLINMGAPATAHSLSGVDWVLPQYDGDALVACEKTPHSQECQALLFPCETAFDIAIGKELSTHSPEIRHDLTACFMAQFNSYQDALWRFAPGSDPDPALSRDTSMMFVHHGNAPGGCRSAQYEKTEDWRCASQKILERLLKLEQGAR